MRYELPVAARQAAEAHARREFPKEACGLVVDGAYLPCFNYALDPETDFVIAGEIWARLAEEGREVQAVVHSHPNGPLYPSAQDMQGQQQTAVPWVIVALDDKDIAPPIIWDSEGEPAPVIGRSFVHGVADCFCLGRDVYRLGRDALAAQGVSGWPLDPVSFPDWPRRDGWWAKEGELAAQNMLLDHYRANGFRIIPANEARPGDAFLVNIQSPTPNHCGVLLEGHLILHHLPTRASRREPIGIWARAVHTWLRHEANDRRLAALEDKSSVTNHA
ncbi:C40 family peptidase [Methylobacterium sp. AMS5]|uniref:C40 family peptidase n=1 Tax=Methylobacterium sp. AMS5 TaxID=925818 RepID=UPI00074F9082|nr:C40 family peptidase [Methylobacterium sp. AMS5]AMB48256.1 hydrolase Nlp/P60 [Methylobacterium sp. AMS5]